MNRPMFTVIVPVYKVEKYLNKCLDSIKKQTFCDFEAILVNDGSPDNSGYICDQYANIDKRFKVIHQSNMGPSEARNRALDIAQGEFLVFIDSDDYVDVNLLEYLNDVIDINNSLDLIIYGYTEILQEENNVWTPLDYDIYTIKSKVIKDEWQSYMWNKCFRREFFTFRFPVGKNMKTCAWRQ